MILSKFLNFKYPIKEQIAGSDLLPAFCNYHKNNTDNVRIFLMGGTPESVLIAKEKINQKTNSDIVIDGYSPPFGFEHDEQETNKMIELVNQSGATVLAMGVGAPKQENWLAEHREKFTDAKILLAIGATIEFESGNLKRAPKWMTAYGLEWAFRLYQEPHRMFQRYIIEDTAILWLTIKQKLGLYRNPWQD